MKEKQKKQCSIILLAFFIVSIFASPIFAGVKDIEKNWAKDVIEKWEKKGIVKGSADGRFRPGDPISRAEFIVLAGRILKLEENTDFRFKDIRGNEWYAPDISKAAAAGLVKGDSEGKARPTEPITRQEACVILFRAFEMDSSGRENNIAFSDSRQISDWSTEAVAAMCEKGYIKGRGNNRFAPKENITRAETIKLIDNIIDELIDKPGTYTGGTRNNVFINTGNVTLKDMTINGGLYLTQGTSQERVSLDNVTVKGDTIVNGSKNSFVSKNSAHRNTLLKAFDASVEIKSGDMENLEVTESAADSQVNISGAGIKNLTIKAESNIRIDGGTVVNLKAGIEAEGTDITIQKGAKIENMTLDSGVVVSGSGAIKSAKINSSGVSIEQKPSNVKISNSVTSEVGGQRLTSSTAPIIRTTHPRVYLTPERITELKPMVTTDGEFISLIKYVDSLIADSTKARNVLYGEFPFKVIQSSCLTAVVTGESKYVNAAKKWLLELMDVPVSQGDDIRQRDRLYNLAIGYDWMYSNLSSDEKKKLADKMIEYLKYFDVNYMFLDKPNFVSGHSRWGNAVTFCATLSLYGEDDRIQPYYDKVYSNWINGYQPVLDYVGRGGGHHMGWRYGAGYSGPEVNLTWYSATGQLWGGSFLKEVPYFYIYGTDPVSSPTAACTGTLPAFGDCWNIATDDYDIANLMACSSGLTKSGLAEGYYQSRLKTIFEGTKAMRIITKSNLPAQVLPTRLPLARIFKGSGFVAIRDTWAGYPDGDPTILIFKSSPFYSQNHHHRDENSFALNHKGPLLIDSGVYDFYGSSHWKNYYTQSVAHNTLVIDNDRGGQKTFSSEPSTLTDIMGTYKLDGIKEFSQSPYSAWVRGDASKAYDSSKLTGYTRDILFVNRPSGLSHPVTMVVDRVKFPTPHIPKILWHVKSAPTLKVGYALIKNDNGGFGRLEFLSPASIKTRTVGGSGYQWYVDGTNYAYGNMTGRQLVEPGWGRIEVSTGGTVTNAAFVTLIEVDDKQIDLPMASLVSGTGWSGAKLKNSLYVVAFDKSAVSAISITAENGAGLTEAYIAGLVPNTEYTVKKGESSYMFKTDNSGMGYCSLS